MMILDLAKLLWNPYVIEGKGLHLSELSSSFIPSRWLIPQIDNEINESGKAINKLGGNLSKPVLFSLPNTDISRSFLIINKEKNTPKAYPRKAGTPSKDPLK